MNGSECGCAFNDQLHLLCLKEVGKNSRDILCGKGLKQKCVAHMGEKHILRDYVNPHSIKYMH